MMLGVVNRGDVNEREGIIAEENADLVHGPFNVKGDKGRELRVQREIPRFLQEFW